MDVVRLIAVALCLCLATNAQDINSQSSPSVPLNSNGIFPGLAAYASSGPRRSECGIGALMPWNDKLYMVSYLSVPRAGSGTALYAVHPNFTKTVVAWHNSTYANRLIHHHSNQIIIGAFAIDLDDQVRTFSSLLHVRIGASAEHLTHPDTMVYMLSMDGPLYECNVYSTKCTKLFNLVKELHIPEKEGEHPHFKAAHTMNGRLYVASNTFTKSDFTGQMHGGRLAEWTGGDQPWKILEKTAFVEVTGRRNFGKVIYAIGWDYRSAILKTFDPSYGHWQTYRLPKGSHAFDQYWQTEWPRIREVETERYLMDAHAIFYELSPLGWNGTTWGLRPISQHLRVIPDFASYKGFLVLAGNQVSPILDNNIVTGQAQSGLWFGKTDDLWNFGKPQGWGAVWRADTVEDGQLSDPFLMTGFDKKVLHMVLNGERLKTATFEIQLDVTGAAGHRGVEDWVVFKTFETNSISSYAYFTFPDGFSVHWVRLRLTCKNNFGQSDACNVTAYFVYT